MKKLFALLVVLFSAATAFAQTPTATPTAAYDFPNAPTQGQSVSGPSGQTLTWDGSKWVAVGGVTGNYAPLVNISGGVNNYAPINAPAFTGTTTATALQVANTLTAPTATLTNLTIPTTGILMMAGSAALYFNGIPPGGTCAAGSAVTSISATMVPTCSPVATGGPFLPLTGGTLNTPGNLTVQGTLTQNGPANFGSGATISFGLQVPNYMSVNGPATFNGSVTLSGNATAALQAVPLQQLNAAIAGGPWLPVNNPTFTGTLTGPNQVNTGGTNSLTWQFPNEGLGASFGDGYGNTSESSFLIGQSMSYTGGVPNSWTLGGTTQYGPTAASSIQMTGAATVITGNIGLTTGQAFLPTMLFSISPVAYPPNQFMGNQPIDAAATFHVPVDLPLIQNSGLIFGPATTPYGAITTWQADNINISAGSHVAGGSWVADATAASIVTGSGGTTTFYSDTGLTAGSNYSPTQVLNVNNTGLNILTGTLFRSGTDQFRVGTWTPLISCGTTAPADNLSSNGQYVTVGNMVWVSGWIGWSTVTGGSGQAYITNLPFNAVDVAGNGILVDNVLIDNASAASGGNRLVGSIFNANNYIRFYETNYGSMGYLFPAPCGNVFANSPSNGRFTAWYRYY